MPFTLNMPKLSPTMAEGVIVKWHKKIGDYVESGEVLLEISTDKATVEHTALDPGYLRKILCNEGDKAEINAPLAIFTESKDESIDGYNVQQAKAQTPAALANSTNATGNSPSAQSQSSSQKEVHETTRVMASPLARKLAKDQNIDLTSVQGSGPRGRIMSKDLKNVTIEQPSAQAAAPCATKAQVTTGPTPFVEEQLSGMRKVIGKRLQASKAHIPHFYIRQDINVDALVTLREELKKQGVSCTVNDFIIKACAIALAKNPNINCGFNEAKETLIRYQRVDISVAVTIPGGLITPIITACDARTLTDISQTVKSLATKAREGKLKPEEYQGGSFTISNLGMYGITSFDAIVNPPQGAILAVGAIDDAVYIKNGTFTAGKKMTVTLSCDHRIIDGAEAAEFMKAVKQLLENPVLALV